MKYIVATKTFYKNFLLYHQYSQFGTKIYTSGTRTKGCIYHEIKSDKFRLDNSVLSYFYANELYVETERKKNAKPKSLNSLCMIQIFFTCLPAAGVVIWSKRLFGMLVLPLH